MKYAMSCRGSFPFFLPHRIRLIKSSELCDCIEDGLKGLQAGSSFRTYVPDLDWHETLGHLGSSSLYEHLTVIATSISSTSEAPNILEEIVLNELHLDKAELDPTIPLTSYGLDSLSASRLSSALKPVLPITQLQLLADITLQDLQDRLKEDVAAPDEVASTASKSKAMEEMVAKHTQDFPSHKGVQPRAPSGKTVLVTGTTGELGCYLLSLLVADPNVVHVYALNRSSPQRPALRERQALALVDRGLDASILDSPKLSLLEGDLVKPMFNLTTVVYEQVSLFVHRSLNRILIFTDATMRHSHHPYR